MMTTPGLADSVVSSLCESQRGESPILLVAPHGGRRPPIDPQAPPAHLRVNDLYTPEVTRLLSAALRAGFLINVQLDRNVLDLNRTSQVRRRAAWFLELLAQEIGHILQRHAHAEVLFVHGWNTGQPKCDVGIGAVESAAGLDIPAGARLTVSPDYLRVRIADLRAACARAGIRASIGERYPASHPNNLLQLFAARAGTSADAGGDRIATWAGEGRVNATQLELGIPLRWPGAWRNRFIDAAADAFRSVTQPAIVTHSKRITQSAATRLTAGPGAGATAAALQFYDAAAEVGVFAGVGRAGPRTWGGRLLLFLGGQRIALFTGEEVGADSRSVAPLRFDTDGEALRLEFAGPMMALEDAAVYMDLEAALAASQLVEARVAVEFHALHPPAADTPARFGVVEGEVTVGGRSVPVHTGGFANAGAFRAAGSGRQTMIAAAFGTERGLLSRVTDGGSVGVHYIAGAVTRLACAAIDVSYDGDTPAAVEWSGEAQLPVHGVPLSRMTILRPVGGDYLRVTFGTARFRCGDEEGYGLYECARPVNRRGA